MYKIVAWRIVPLYHVSPSWIWLLSNIFTPLKWYKDQKTIRNLAQNVKYLYVVRILA